MAISAGWGLGVGVVDGSITTDTLWLRRDDLAVVERRIAQKDACYILDESAGLVQGEVSAAKRGIACLPDAWAQRIAQFARAAEQVFGRPQDVEWAIADGQVWILQSRPIASLVADQTRRSHFFPVAWENSSDARRFWWGTRDESQENRPLVPLEVDYTRLLKSTRLETCLLVGADRNQEMQVFNGWIFTSPAPVPLDQAGMRVRQQAFRDLEARLARQEYTAWDHWGSEIEQANQRLAAVDPSRLDAPGLANFLEQAMATRSRHNMLHPLMWFKASQPYFDAFQAVSGLTATEAETAAYRLLEGEESPLTQLVDGLYRLAEAARHLPAVAAWMRQAGDHLTAGAVNEHTGFPLQTPGAANWRDQLQTFLAEFGDRNGDGYGSEALITTPTWRDQPLRAVQVAAQFLDAAEPPSQQRQRARQAMDTEVDALCARCADSQRIQEFLQQLRYARRVQAVVEVHNHHIEKIGLGQLRRAVLAAGQWLKSAELLTDTDDIFWLYFAEILAALRGPEQEPLAKMILARKEEHQQWAQYEPPPHLGLPQAALPPRPDDAATILPGSPDTAGRLHGLGASAGFARGRARIVKAGQAAPQISPGDILVAENAGPLWLPFFPVLAGIVLESGSLGQHAASTAREYGLPAVIAVPNATQQIKDGDWIRMDGTNGSVDLETINC